MRFLPSGRFTPVLPPTAASIWASHVADDTAAEREDDVVAQQAPGREVPAEAFDGRERLRRLAVADEEQLGVRRAGPHGAGMALGHHGLADDGNAAATGEQRAELAERARADDDV